MFYRSKMENLIAKQRKKITWLVRNFTFGHIWPFMLNLWPVFSLASIRTRATGRMPIFGQVSYFGHAWPVYYRRSRASSGAFAAVAYYCMSLVRSVSVPFRKTNTDNCIILLCFIVFSIISLVFLPVAEPS